MIGRIPARAKWWQGAYAVERYSAERKAWEVIDSDDDPTAARDDAKALHERYGFPYRTTEQRTGRVLETFGV